MHTRRPGTAGDIPPPCGEGGRPKAGRVGVSRVGCSDEVGIRAAINSQWRAGGLSCQSKSPAHFVNVAGRSECGLNQPPPDRPPATHVWARTTLVSTSRGGIEVILRSKILLASYDRRSGQSDKRNCDEWISVEKPTHEETKRNNRKQKTRSIQIRSFTGPKAFRIRRCAFARRRSFPVVQLKEENLAFVTLPVAMCFIRFKSYLWP